MGCSPSKGQLFSKKAALPSASPEIKKNPDPLSDGEQIQSHAEVSTASEGLAAAETEENARNSQGERGSVDNGVGDATVIVQEDATEEMLDVVRPHDGQSAQEGLLEELKEGVEEKRTKETQVKRKKQRKQRLRKNSYVLSKAEFILKAHQAAYVYLNPSISKYESLFGLLSQTAQTQRSLQTTVASVVLHFEEINQALEELAADGEQLLREHGHNMTWPASLKDYPPTAAKASELNGSQLPSEALQQMLLQSTVKIISVGDSVKSLGDSTLQELAQYFGSVSELLGEKLLAKHAAEERLKQVLFHVEAAAFRKPSAEDSALHSEDSGIGAENESQNGSERLRRSRGSSGSGANAGITSVFSLDRQLLNANEEATDDDEEDDDEDDGDDDEEAELEDEVRGKDEMERLTDKKKGTTCVPCEADSSHPPLQGALQDKVKTGNLKRKVRRPKTADNNSQVTQKNRHLRGPKRSQSAECLCSVEKESDPHKRQGNRRNTHWRRSNNLPEDLVHGGRLRTKIRRGSSGGQSADRYYGLQYGSKGPFRAVPPSSPPTFVPEPPGRNAVKRLINTFSQGVEDNLRQSPLDQRPRARGHKKCSLPLLQNSTALTTGSSHPLADRPEHLDIDSLPPPPPEMLMDSSFDSGAGLPTEEGAHEARCRGQRLRALTHRETVPLDRANMHRDSGRRDSFLGSCAEQEYKQGTEGDAEHTLQFHQPDESSSKPALTDAGARSYQRCEIDNEGENPTVHSKCFPPTTPPVSRTRLPPSCPSVHHTVPSPPSTVWPPSGRWTPSTKPATAAQHRSDQNCPPTSGSQSYLEARAKFCQETQTWTPSCTSTLPRPWGEQARGRVSTGRLQPSGHRPQTRSEPQPLLDITAQGGQRGDVTP